MEGTLDMMVMPGRNELMDSLISFLLGLVTSMIPLGVGNDTTITAEPTNSMTRPTRYANERFSMKFYL